MIRWKALVPTAAVLGAVALLLILFLDTWVKWGLENSLEAVFGAKVEIAFVDVRLRESALRLKGVRIADRSAPMTNLVELGEAVFDGRALPLLEKKFVVEDASLTGLRFGTPRKTSGALSKRQTRRGFVGKAMDRVWAEVRAVSFDKLGQLQAFVDPKTVIPLSELEGTLDGFRQGAFSPLDEQTRGVDELPKLLEQARPRLRLP